MPSVKVKFRPSSIEGREGSVYYQIIHERKVRQIQTLYHIFPHEWDESHSMVMAGTESGRRNFILEIRERIRWDLERINRITRRLSVGNPDFSADDIIEEFNRFADEYTVANYMESIIARLKRDDRIRTAETYRATLSSFMNFLSSKTPEGTPGNADLFLLDCITSEMLESYQAWQKNRGLAPNTISFYMRILRAVYNRAAEDEIIENRHPFRKVYTGVEKTAKRALPLPVIKKIKTLDLSLSPHLDFARDMFLMSFYLRGMSFVDMAYLRKEDYHDGYIVYRRRKTGQQLFIEWTREMQHIVDKYPDTGSVYLLPVIKDTAEDHRHSYLNAGSRINNALKKIAGKIGVSIPLTLYVARHSWASAAKAKGIPIDVISEGMGHDSEATTRIYLASLDNTVVDRANAKILKSLK